MKKLLNNATRFLTVSLALVLLLTVCIFSFLAYFMVHKSNETISTVGTTYMSGMGEKVTQHFATTIELRLSQVDALVKSFPELDGPSASLRSDLTFNAKARDFESLAFYSSSGEFDMIYGDPPTLSNPEPFLASMNNGDKKVAVADTNHGERDVILGVSAEYTMSNGETSTALVASLPADYIAETLSLYSETSLVYSHIIRRDGTFVIRSGGAYRENYFDRIQALFEEQGESGDILVQKAPACTIEVLAKAVAGLFKPDTEIQVIGIRHGEKLYETLLTNEECANAVDLGAFYRVPCDKRDLNYDKYFRHGSLERNVLTEFNSSNTELLDVEQVKEKLLSLQFIRDELSKWEGR